MDKDFAYKAKYFTLSFCAAFFVMSLSFLFLMSVTHPRSAQGIAESAAAVLEPVYSPEEADALTLLVFGVEEPDSAAGTFLLLRFDPLHGGISVAVLPPQTVISHGGGEETLSDAYRYGGALYTREALSSYLGISIDRYARISVAEFVAAAAAVGSVEYELREDLVLRDGELSVTLNAGIQLLDGRKVAALIRRPDYPGGEAERCEITADIVCAVINQRIDVVNSTLCDKIFQTVVNLVDTDISYADYEQRKNAAEQMAARGGTPAEVIAGRGEFAENGAKYIPADTFLAELAQRFL